VARLPKPGKDTGTWGDILNAFLSVAHNDDGTVKDAGVVAAKYALPDDGIPETDLSNDVQTKLNTASNGDIAAIAGLSPNNNDILQRKSGAWTNRTPAQVKTDLALVKADVNLGNVDNTADLDKPISTDTQAALDEKAAWLGTGLHASRPAASAGAGIWLSTNIDGGTQYYSNGSTWTQLGSGVLDSGGQELAYTELNAFSTTTGNVWSAKNGFGAQTRALTASTLEDITGLSVTWTPEDTRPVNINVAVYNITIPTDGALVGVRLLLDAGDGAGFVNVGQQNINAPAAGASARFQFSTRIPNGSQTLGVGVSATAKVQIFSTSSLTVTGYAGSGALGNFYPYIQVVRA
jgi:hypothetical protein